jgi:hypothetical protein
MRRTARLQTLARGADPRRRAKYSTNSAPDDDADLGASDSAAPAPPTLGRRGLHSPRMSHASGRPGDVDWCQRRRTEHPDDEREWEKALAGEMHG